MNIIFELLIIVAISLFWVFFSALILCFGKDEHCYIRSEGIEKNNYLLNKTIFLFLPAFLMTRNWKTGIIRKDTFWGLIIIYIYQLCFFLSDLIFYLVTQSNMVIEKPFVFVILVLVPLLGSPILRIITTKMLSKRNVE